ncbi:MAG TPA: 23S rRNA (guanosine(2251)-2'-O)-methyltransferase RlmB [Elusimicrobia bacterium]|nr:MAG: 23S rRNA (guanosine(2251)-2'-O)-methyltransferase RlmB [Elusimicrobia bacterium GWD2_63_28]HCC49019.1 23S rRNA (guanosine(2251)-2'-O)-methyltransferase RlmB [Elusimicrobiota bacterium]
MSTEILFGINTAEEILNAGRRRVVRLLISRDEKGARVNALSGLARSKGVPVEFCSSNVLEKLSKGGHHQGVIIEAEPPKKLTLDDALHLIRDPKKTIWTALDGITDPMNLGAIIRSAACFGVTTVVLPERRSAGLTPTAQKAASGALERVNVVEVVNLNQTILKLKEKGFWIYGLDMGGKPMPQVEFTLPAFIIIGSEGEGLHQKTREHCDEMVSIPQKGGVQSLNASNAAAVTFYELSKKIN